MDEAAKRMADMTGYTPREKLATVVASLLPFMILASSVGHRRDHLASARGSTLGERPTSLR